MPTASALFQVAGLTVLFGRLEFDSVHAHGIPALLCVLAACHLVAGGGHVAASAPSCRRGRSVRLGDRRGTRRRRRGRAARRRSAAGLLGRRGARDALALRPLRRSQAGVTAALLGVLTLGWSLYAGPARRRSPTRSPSWRPGCSHSLRLVVMLGGAAILLRGVRQAAIAFAVSLMGRPLLRRGRGSSSALPPFRRQARRPARPALRHARLGACSRPPAALAVARACRRASARRRASSPSSTLWVIAAKALAIDSLALGMHETRLLWLLAGLRRPRGRARGHRAVDAGGQESRCHSRRRSHSCS